MKAFLSKEKSKMLANLMAQRIPSMHKAATEASSVFYVENLSINQKNIIKLLIF